MEDGKNKIMTEQIRVYGIVQGVGFRPLVYRTAKEYGIKGLVRNVGGYVEIVAQSESDLIGRFLADLKDNKKGGHEIMKMEAEEIPFMDLEDFAILKSESMGEISVIPPDLPVCPECLRELSEESDRRYGNPFISCVSCGPRYTIMEELPYDRKRTTMEDFPLCSECQKEYTWAAGRRFHAQTVSCNDCGPYLIYHHKGNGPMERKEKEAFEKALTVLSKGGIVAVKGIGGFHLVCSPFREDTVKRLRKLKGREEKPFAVMFPGIQEISRCCLVSAEEKALLESKARPIVLLSIKQDTMAPSVSNESIYCGAFLPYTPLQHMLTKRLGPLIMTSANIAGQPIIREDESMLALSSPYLDGVLYNQRRIVRSVDDSVARIIEGMPQLIRRSRGYVPYPVFLSRGEGSREEGEGGTKTGIFAAGGDLKAAFCLCQKGNAVVSQHFGDLEEEAVRKEFQRSYEDLTRLLRITPGLAVCDLHPNYHSARFAEALGLPVLKVQHHHAHVASVMAEHDLKGPVIGVAFDGTGCGTDRSIWGGEFLVCEGIDFIRAGHVSMFPILGGDSSMRDARKTASCCLLHAGLTAYIEDERLEVIKAALEHNINRVLTSSVGRLFDGAASVLNIGHENRYEGECAVLLEREAVLGERNRVKPVSLSFGIKEQDDVLTLDPRPVFETLCTMRNRAETGALALGFHLALAQAVASVCKRLGSRYLSNTVALSGGVFQNALLTRHTIGLLKKNGFFVYLNSAVPPNDGGLSLGQAYLGNEYLKSGIRDLERTGCHVCCSSGKSDSNKGGLRKD
ncbi:carbamoyltransferase HypF [Lacrimispora saccharolytica]|uniref:Carbamoyltransferase n=1 Tax=Lacrimispora saccharolytica (strain ATCC 35040 / DSM 2544 / NRCC 2533 / WM1) TaxID=610130 RepID=D9R571_LACSW|nr:carbamoyltransferase HypF [Lacrimispora saccharolytica]ADL05178.1 (NiFe) hydrogenase maturation protein HypF [[Clostridium] saccharolyticum WM1]QRV20641.1 carbamoyltransferase HypF [Lacrimispora saccharolytica]